MLKFYLLLTVAIPLAQAIRLFLTNDDGWDDFNVRTLFNLLDTTTDHQLILCATQHGYPKPPLPLPPKESPSELSPASHDKESFTSDDKTPWHEGDILFDGNNFINYLESCTSKFGNIEPPNQLPPGKVPDDKGSWTNNDDKPHSDRELSVIDQIIANLNFCTHKYRKIEAPKLLPPGEVSDDKWSLNPGDDFFSDDDSLITFLEGKEPNNGWKRLNSRSLADSHRALWPWGFDNSDIRLNYVTDDLDPTHALIDGRVFLEPMLYRENESKEGSRKPKHAHLYLAGPRVGSSVGEERQFDRSLVAIKDGALKGHSGISFAGANGPNEFRERSSKIYAQLAKRIIKTLIQGGKPYLPRLGYLHVNFPHVTDKTCNHVSQFQFVLTSEKPTDLPWLINKWCGRKSFPLERDVIHKDGCYVAISFETTARSMRARDQWTIIRKLMPILSCIYDKDK